MNEKIKTERKIKTKLETKIETKTEKITQKLTQKQEFFVKEYLIDLNSTRAYKEVYKCSDKVANASWPRMLVNVSIQKKIQEKFDERSKKVELDAEWVLRNLKEVYEEARENKSYSSSIKALELIGKHIWMFADKNEPAEKPYGLLDVFRDIEKNRKEKEEKEKLEKTEEKEINESNDYYDEDYPPDNKIKTRW